MALSGPGAGYYPTSMLQRGETVTIVGKRHGDWVAILPPSGSFSWVVAEDVEEREDGTGIVRAEQTKPRVGSSLSDARHVFQVALQQGSVVHILDHVYLKDDAQAKGWYKIRPPEREARYVAISDLKLPDSATANVGSAGGGASLPSTGLEPVATVTNRVIPSAKRTGGTDAEVALTPTSLSAKPDSKPSGQSSSDSIPGEPTPTRGPPVTFTDDPGAPLPRRIASLRNQLELMRTRDPRTWDVEPARKIGEELMAKTQDRDLRDEILALLAEIKQLGTLKTRYENAVRQRELALQRDEELAQLLQRKVQEMRGSQPRYVAEGTLRKAAVRVDDLPTFSLTDSKGTVVYYVVGAPGLNLEPHLGRVVGLDGATQPHPRLPAPVLTATQVTLLGQRP